MTAAGLGSKLLELFGAAGIASAAAWPAALVVLAAFAVGARRTRAWRAALAVAALGYALGLVNSSRVSAYREDPKEIAARLGRERRAQAAPAEPEERKEREGAADVRFAEDSPADRLDLAGVRTGGGEAEGGPSGEKLPAFKRRGKQEREAGKRRSETAPEEAAGGEAPPPPLQAVAEVDEEGPFLPEADVILANRLDRANLAGLRLALALAASLVAWDWLRGFNGTRGLAPVLPAAGRLVDAVSPKAHAVCLAGAGERELARLLETAVRKGETFVHLGEADPWPGRAALARLPFGAWPLAKVSLADRSLPHDDAFVLESAWYGRYCFVAADAARARGLLAELARFLEARRSTGARARRTVNVAWDLAEPPAAREVEELRFLARETNFRVIVRTRGPCPAELAPLFDETICGAGPATAGAR